MKILSLQRLPTDREALGMECDAFPPPIVRNARKNVATTRWFVAKNRHVSSIIQPFEGVKSVDDKYVTSIYDWYPLLDDTVKVGQTMKTITMENEKVDQSSR